LSARNARNEKTAPVAERFDASFYLEDGIAHGRQDRNSDTRGGQFGFHHPRLVGQRVTLRQELPPTSLHSPRKADRKRGNGTPDKAEVVGN
jgi:hypothetical protein